MKKILLTQGKVAIVDDEDYEILFKFKWCCAHGYAVRNSSTDHGKSKLIYMHREIMQTPDGMETDHINGDRLDNRRETLRVCEHSQNLINRSLQRNNTSGYKGVSWDKKRKIWRADIFPKGSHVSIGIYKNIEMAARAYDDKAKEIYGEFAKLNFGTGAI